MCFLMGASAGGLMPVAYPLLAALAPPRQRGLILVLVGGTGLLGGYLAASFAAGVLEPGYRWRSLWLLGLPTGVLLLLLTRAIPSRRAFSRCKTRARTGRVARAVRAGGRRGRARTARARGWRSTARSSR